MKTMVQVLTVEERERVHEHTLALLAGKGMRVDTAQGRRILREAGAQVDEADRMVRFPEELVERSLALATKEFSLGGRRPGWSVEMNAGGFTLLADGGATSVIDRVTHERRTPTKTDWIETTRLLDAIDDIGLYWWMVEFGLDVSTPAGFLSYWRDLTANFSKHVQDSWGEPALSPWALEVLETVYGGREAVRRIHPFSFLITPTSPLVIERQFTEAWLALRGYDIPVAIMPMPLMGATAPASMISTIVQANAETLGVICLVQAADPGTPIIYAPVFAAMDPRSGRLGGGAIEHAVMAAAGTELARFYGLAVEASGCGTDHYVPGIQTTYEKATTAMMSALSWPDILVGPGTLGGSLILSFEQLILDVELFRICAQAQRGVATAEDRWLDEVLDRVKPAGNYLAEPSTRKHARDGEWFLSELGTHETYDSWDAGGRVSIEEQAREKVDTLLATHEPLALDPDVVGELGKLQKKADQALASV